MQTRMTQTAGSGFEENKRIAPTVAAMLGIAVLTMAAGCSQENNADKVIAAVNSSHEDLVAMLAKDASGAGASSAVGTRQSAAGQRALVLGQAAFASGDHEKALLYYINGLNHDPSRGELIDRVVDVAMMIAPSELAERALGVLELATLQVAPDDLDALLEKIASLRTRLAPPAAERLSPEQAVAEIQKISDQYNPDAIWKDPEQLAAGNAQIEFMQQLLEETLVSEQAAAYSDAINKSQELLERIQNIQSVYPLYHHVTACLSQMVEVAASANPDKSRFAALSASAQATLSQVWGATGSLPDSMKSEIEALPMRLDASEKQLQEKVSKPVFAKAVEDLKNARDDQSGTITARMRRLINATESAATQIEYITDQSMRMQLFDFIKKGRDAIAALELERRKAYQLKSLASLKGFLDGWNSNKSISNKEAWALFYKHNIPQIDETLLVPEVSRVLNRVITLMVGELNGSDGSWAEHQMASGKKNRLDDL
mgnify:CR=1 FL=1